MSLLDQIKAMGLSVDLALSVKDPELLIDTHLKDYGKINKRKKKLSEVEVGKLIACHNTATNLTSILMLGIPIRDLTGRYRECADVSFVMKVTYYQHSVVAVHRRGHGVEILEGWAELSGMGNAIVDQDDRVLTQEEFFGILDKMSGFNADGTDLGRISSINEQGWGTYSENMKNFKVEGDMHTAGNIEAGMLQLQVKSDKWKKALMVDNKSLFDKLHEIKNEL